MSNKQKGILNIPALQFESLQIDLTVANQIQSFLDELSREAARAGDRVQKMLQESANRFNEQHAIWEKHWKEQSTQIAGAVKRVANAFQRAEAVGKYGWTISLDSTPREIVSMFDVITDEASADAAFVWHFTHNGEENLTHLIQKILSDLTLRHWRPLLEEAIFCLQEKKFRACISSLLPIVEGLCAQRFSIPQFQDGKKRKAFLSGRRQKATRDNDINGFMWLSFIGFAETIFRCGAFNRTTLVLNRHILLHGRDIPQGKLEDCLRLLQALDTIASLDF